MADGEQESRDQDPRIWRHWVEPGQIVFERPAWEVATGVPNLDQAWLQLARVAIRRGGDVYLLPVGGLNEYAFQNENGQTVTVGRNRAFSPVHPTEVYPTLFDAIEASLNHRRREAKHCADFVAAMYELSCLAHDQYCERCDAPGDREAAKTD